MGPPGIQPFTNKTMPVQHFLTVHSSGTLKCHWMASVEPAQTHADTNLIKIYTPHYYSAKYQDSPGSARPRLMSFVCNNSSGWGLNLLFWWERILKLNTNDCIFSSDWSFVFTIELFTPSIRIHKEFTLFFTAFLASGLVSRLFVRRSVDLLPMDKALHEHWMRKFISNE